MKGKRQMRKEKKKVIFSEEIDNAITGYAIGISFFGIGLFLLLNPSYFSSQIASYIVGAIIGCIGVLGTGVQLSKSSKIKGADNLFLGLIFLAFWLISYLYINALWANIVFFVLLFLGCYAVLLGIFQGVYSIIYNHKEQIKNNNKKSIGALLSQSVLFITQLCSLIIAILNIIKAVNA